MPITCDGSSSGTSVCRNQRRSVVSYGSPSSRDDEPSYRDDGPSQGEAARRRGTTSVVRGRQPVAGYGSPSSRDDEASYRDDGLSQVAAARRTGALGPNCIDAGLSHRSRCSTRNRTSNCWTVPDSLPSRCRRGSGRRNIPRWKSRNLHPSSTGWCRSPGSPATEDCARCRS